MLKVDGSMKNRYLHILVLWVALMAFALDGMAQNDRQLIRQGNRLFRQQQYAKAEVEYRKAIGKNAGNAQAYYNLGCALQAQQKDSAAIIQYQKSAQLEKGKVRKAKVYHNIGTICQGHQMFGEAMFSSHFTSSVSLVSLS
mgnify:CR=1 FL=1